MTKRKGCGYVLLLLWFVLTLIPATNATFLMPLKDGYVREVHFFSVFVTSQLQGEAGQHMVACVAGKGLLDFAEAQAQCASKAGQKIKSPWCCPALQRMGLCGKRSIGR